MNKQTGESPDVGYSVPVLAIAAALVAVLVLIAGAWLYRSVSTEVTHRPIVIATGPESGAYHSLAKVLQRFLERTGAFSSVTLLTTDGSVENMELIGETDGDVDIAFIQGDAAPTANTRLITPLYEEALHILVSAPDAASIETIYDLEGKDVSLGGAGSGTRELAERVLKHFGVTIGKDHLLTPSQAATALAREQLDAAFILTAMPSGLVSELAAADKIRIIGLGGPAETGDEAHALELVLPGVYRTTIPKATYARQPETAIYTVSVAAMLVARDDLDENLVRQITSTVFSYRYGAAGLESSAHPVARRIRENYDPAAADIPYHSGATAYYLRKEPPFFVEYAEALSLLLTFLLALYSIFIAVREWLRRRMKNRVDRYLLDVERLAADIHTVGQDELLDRQRELEELRRAAFDDLVSERLLADAAFIILQNHLRDELAAIESRVRQFR